MFLFFFFFYTMTTTKKLTVSIPVLVKADGKYEIQMKDGEPVTKKQVYFVFGRDEDHAQKVAEIVLRTINATSLEYRGTTMTKFAEA
jgi:hypothetical protein